MSSAVSATWELDWLWSLPLIVMNVVIHVVGLMIIFREAVKIMSIAVVRRRFVPMFIVVMGVVALLATVLHGLEGAVWAAAYRLLGALPDGKSAMLYSLSAMTSYGHATLFLKDSWQLMGALEALNGTLLFGLTTAFLFAMIREVWDIEWRERRRSQKPDLTATKNTTWDRNESIQTPNPRAQRMPPCRHGIYG
jgi:hypothetical protein